MGELPFFIDHDALWGKELVPIDGLTDAGSAQAVQSFEFDEGGKDMDCHRVACKRARELLGPEDECV